MTESGRPSGEDGHFRATTDSIARSAERVAELEEEKSQLSPSDPKARELTSEVESEVERMDRDTDVQRSLVDEAAGDRPARRN